MMDLSRRRFLQAGAAVGVGAMAGPFQGFLAGPTPVGASATAGYGPIGPVFDQRDGALRLDLPAGFSYRSFDVAKQPWFGLASLPGRPDGMATFLSPTRHTYYLVRNHEQRSNEGGAFGDATKAYDTAGAGGTTTVVVDREGHVSDGWVSLNGTQYNCAGGRTPWGTWLTCEETINGPDVGNDFAGGSNAVLTQRHGYVFEVPPKGVSNGQPIRSAGRFPHEAAAVDPVFGYLYLTEDSFLTASGFYRYKPPTHPLKARKIVDGGRLQMLKVKGVDNADLSLALGIGTKLKVEWVDIDDPDPTYGGITNDAATPVVGNQGRAKGAAIFSRLEGCDYQLGLIYFTDMVDRLTLETIIADHPGLIEGLVAHDGIGFVLVRSAVHGAVAMGRNGVHYLREHRVEGSDPLADYGSYAHAQLLRFDAFPHCGDVVVNGRYHPSADEVESFEEMVGTHGGLGGAQTHGFLMHPSSWAVPSEEISNSEDLHQLFVRWRDALAAGIDPAGANVDGPPADAI
jgi:hypothetical protein